VIMGVSISTDHQSPLSVEIPQSFFDCHKFHITGEASELVAGAFNFLGQVAGGQIGFWMLTRRSRILFLLTKEEREGRTTSLWRFTSSGWTPTGKSVHLTIYNA